LPLIEGEPAPQERIQQLKAKGELNDEDLAELEAKISAYAKKLEGISSKMKKIHARRDGQVRELYTGETRGLLQAKVGPIRERFPAQEVGEFFDRLIEDVLKHGVE